MVKRVLQECTIYKDIEYIDYLTAEYKGRIRFYLKEEKNEQ